MEPMYVDNLSSLIEASKTLFLEDLMKTDEHFKGRKEDPRITFGIVITELIVHVALAMHIDITDWVFVPVFNGKEQGNFYNRSITKARLLLILRSALMMAEIEPVSQDEARGLRG